MAKHFMPPLLVHDSGWIKSSDERFNADFERKLTFIEVPTKKEELEMFWNEAPGKHGRVIRLWPDGSCTFYCNIKKAIGKSR